MCAGLNLSDQDELFAQLTAYLREHWCVAVLLCVLLFVVVVASGLSWRECVAVLGGALCGCM